MVRTRVSKRREDGEIPIDRANKMPRGSDPPPPAVAQDARPPKEKVGYGGRGDPKGKGVFQTKYIPEPQVPRKTAKRLAENYEGFRPAILCTGPLLHSSAAHPAINNMPDPRVGVMLSEDNALAAAQAVVTSSQSDMDHYITAGGRYEREWLQKDIKANLDRTLVVVDVQNHMFDDLSNTSRD